MRWIGIDPGSRHCGWGLVERRSGRLVAVDWGRISPPSTLSVAERLAVLATSLEALVEAHRPDRAAVERVFQGVSPRSLIVLAEARGVVLAVLARAGLPVAEWTPAEVKSTVAGHGRADKAAVAKMVRLELGLGAGAVPQDASDALALALAEGQRSRLRESVLSQVR